MIITKDGAFYRRYLPHYRSPGGIYHCRLSLKPYFRLTENWMFKIIEDSILMEHKKESLIYAYIIMPNHAHLVLQPLPKTNTPSAWCDYREFHSLELIAGRIKGRSARLINQQYGRRGKLWQKESFDRTVRNMRDLENAIDYVHHNPVRWKLVECPEQYRWSSLRTIYSGGEKYRDWFEFPFIGEQK